jgi:hypothetical protein
MEVYPALVYVRETPDADLLRETIVQRLMELEVAADSPVAPLVQFAGASPLFCRRREACLERLLRLDRCQRDGVNNIIDESAAGQVVHRLA